MTRTSLQLEQRDRSSSWSGRWSRFLTDHGDWWRDRIACADAIYPIPGPILDEMCAVGRSGQRRTAGRRLFSGCEERSERAFTALCQQWCEQVTGVTRSVGRIQYELLSSELATSRLSRAGGTDCIDRILLEGRNRYFDIAQSQMVHASYLIQQPDYWRELTALRYKFDELRHTLDLPFCSISGKLVPFDAWVVQMRGAREGSSAEHDFRLAIWHFTKKWEISTFLTWELPVPKRPIALPPRPTCETHRISEPLSYDLPRYFPLSRLHGDDAPIWQASDPHCVMNGMGKMARGERVARKHFYIIQAYIAELAVRQRFAGSLPSAECLNQGLARVLGISEEQAGKRVRKYLPSECKEFMQSSSIR